MAETAITTDILTTHEPMMFFSSAAAVNLLKARVRINSQYIVKPDWNENHTGLASCDGMLVPASEFTRQVNGAIQTDESAAEQIHSVIFHELGAPNSPLQPTERIQTGLKQYEQLVERAQGNVDTGPLQILSSDLRRQIDFLQGLAHYQEHAVKPLARNIAICLPEVNTLQSYARQLAVLDGFAGLRPSSSGDSQPNTTLQIPLSTRPKTLHNILNEEGAFQ